MQQCIQCTYYARMNKLFLLESHTHETHTRTQYSHGTYRTVKSFKCQMNNLYCLPLEVLKKKLFIKKEM